MNRSTCSKRHSRFVPSKSCLRSTSFAESGEPAIMLPVGGRPIMRFKDEVAEALKQHRSSI